VPTRPHPIVLGALALAVAFVALMVLPGPARPAGGTPYVRGAPAPAPRGAWRWPVRGRVVGFFHLTRRRPFARGQRRGIDIAATPGAPVLAACAGRVRFAGALPARGLAVALRCGRLVATEIGLARLAVRRGARVRPGAVVGALGAGGVLRLGARRSGARLGYLDPLGLLREPRPLAPPALGPAPRARLPRLAPPPPWRLRPAARRVPAAPARFERRLPWPAYPALALVATALPVGGLVRRRRRRAARRTALASHGG
jgi:murein DD-endopeptidase MepM/ murein hydrolase activator NlpD